MPVFQETSHAARDLRILPSTVTPLPRLTPIPNGDDKSKDEYEVVVIGAGPAGMFMNLCLAKYGLRDNSLLCLDAKPGTLKAGQADGLQPRTLEVLQSLGVAHEILSEGCHMSEVAFWNAKHANTSEELATGSEENESEIVRTSLVPDVTVAARYEHEVTIHQGRIERILEEELRHYSQRGIMRSHHFVSFELDENKDAEFPVLIEVDHVTEDGTRERRSLKAKHLVGADGAHSQVRRSMGLKLEGETTDHIWGVVDFVAETDFPDVRRRCAIHSDAGSVMIIPRERISTGQYLTRLYVQIKDDEVPTDPTDVDTGDNRAAQSLARSKERRAAITLEYIFQQAERVFKPYKIGVKSGTVVDWWAAYQIGQRMAPKFSLKDDNGIERVFIVGDACHTHSPKAGQGMNVSMMDSYNLAWKLVHSLHGLTPKSATKSQDRILASYEHERLTVARQLIEFDSKFSSMFSGQMGAADPQANNLTHEQFLKVFSDGSGFTSGCGIEYPDSLLVRDHDPSSSLHNPVFGNDYLRGTLKAGRRLLNTRVKRYADSNRRNLQDDFPSTGRYRILVFASSDLLHPTGHSVTALEEICNHIIPSFPKDTVELVAIHPIRATRFEWTEVPCCLKQTAEMHFHGLGEDDAYKTYGVAEHEGAIAVVRPDGYVGIVVHLADVEKVHVFLKGCLVSM